MEKLKDSRFELIDSSKLDADLVVRPNISYWKDAWRRLKKNPIAMGALFILLVITIILCIHNLYNYLCMVLLILIMNPI